MNIEEAVVIFKNSLSIDLKSSSAWSPFNARREKFLKERLEELRSSFIDPYIMDITPGPVACSYGDWEPRPYEMYVLAKLNEHALFLNSETGLFSLGKIDASGNGSILGFASEDALAQWID